MARNDERPFEFDVQKHLKGVDYPASKQELLDAAADNDAPDEVMDALGRIDDREYDGPPAVTEAIKDLD